MIEVKMRLALKEGLPILSVTDSIEGLLGFSPEDFLSGRKTLKDRIHCDDSDIADTLFASDLNHAFGDFNIRLRQANGRIRCIKGQYQKFLDESDHITILDLLLQDAKGLRQRLGIPPITDRFRALLENTDDYIYFKDRNHVFTGASKTLVTLTSPVNDWTDLLGQTDYDVFPEEYADIYYRLEKQVFTGIPVAHEVQETQTKEGKKGWVDNRKYPIRDQAGEIVGLFGVARDITENKKIEDAIAESEQRFRSIFEQAPMISVQGYDRDRRVILWNQASERLYGFSREEALGRTLEELIIPESQRETLIGLISAWAEGGPAIPASELTLQNADGAPVEVFSSHVMLRDKNGEPEMYCIDLDISERKRVAAELRREQQFSQSVLDNLPEIFYLYAYPENRLVLWNKRHEILLGYSAEEMKGRHVLDFHLPEDKDAVLAAIDQVMIAGQHSIEAPLVAKDGRRRYFFLTGVKFETPDHSYFMGTGTDISERKRLEEEIRQLAFHDPLTNLPNRRLLNDRLFQAMAISKRSGCYGTLMFLDLDNFKPLNDRHGHEVGDLLLIEVAARLKNCVREMDTVARFGGDEFVVMACELSTDKAVSISQACVIAEKIRVALSDPYFLTVKRDVDVDVVVEHHCTASIGLTLFLGDETTLDDMLSQSDTAMYQAKVAGRNAVQVASKILGSSERNVSASFLHLVWHSSYESGDALIDDQHRALFEGANKLLMAMFAERPKEEVVPLIDALIKHVTQHFKDEELIIAEAGFPGAAEHAAIHHQLTESALELVNRFHSGTLAIGQLLQFLVYDMVARHMLGADKEFFPYLKDRH